MVEHSISKVRLGDLGKLRYFSSSLSQEILKFSTLSCSRPSLPHFPHKKSVTPIPSKNADFQGRAIKHSGRGPQQKETPTLTRCWLFLHASLADSASYSASIRLTKASFRSTPGVGGTLSQTAALGVTTGKKVLRLLGRVSTS
jgi:hypothetical protein